MKNDQIYTFEKVPILIHSGDFVYFNNTKLDYIKDVFGSGKFKLLKV